MTDLFNFNKEDVLSGATAEQAVLKTKGFFGDSLHELINAVEWNKVRTLSYIDKFDAYCFTDEHTQHYTLFLPLDKISHTYRPLRTFDELFNFLIPDIDVDCGTFEKVKCILCRIYELRGKQTGNICYKCFSQICLTEEGDIMLDARDLEHFFENYEIKKDGEWQPFGILEE